MKGPRIALLACILVCAFLAGGFVNLASAATPKVTVTPSKPAVKLGVTQQFKATVTGVRAPPLTWSLDATSVTNGCSINSSTGLLSVPATVAAPDSWNPVVTATYSGVLPAISGTATFTITDPSPPPGLFMGSATCTGGSCDGEGWHLAMNLKNGGAIDVLSINGNLDGYETFSGAIILKTNEVHATYKSSSKTYTLLGQVGYSGGTAEVMAGSLYESGTVEPVGTWEVDLTSTGLAKVGTVHITDASLAGRAFSGTLAGMATPASPTDFFGVLEVPQYNRVASSTGSWEQTGNDVTFTSTINGYLVTGTGTISATGQISGDLDYPPGTKVGTYSLHNP